MPDEDVIDDGGLEPAEVTAEADAPEVEAVEPEPEETYTRAQLAELLGPRFERFATHEGPEAFRQFGSAYDSATGLIRQGAHLEPQDPSVYEQIGLDPSEVQQAPEPEQERAQIFGAPWEQPTTWDEFVAYAQSDSPEQRRLAAYGVLNADGPDDQTKQWFYNQWAQADPYGAAAYLQQSSQTSVEQMRQELRDELMAELAPLHGDRIEQQITDLAEAARTQIPGFEENAGLINDLFFERANREPAFSEWFFRSASREEQMRELRRINYIAAAESAPAREAAQQAAVEETDASKIRARTQTSRTNGAPDMDAAALKRQSIEEAKRVFGQVR